MDTNRFDALATRLARRHSRRGASILGLLGVSGLAATRFVEAGKRKKKKKKNKKKNKTCASCPPCQQCQQGACVAMADQTPCGGGNLCDAGACRAPRCGDPGIDCLVFISSQTYTGNLGGLAGADARCQSLASAAGIPGWFMAWLSDNSASPATRFPTRSSSPYRLLNGAKIADNWADLTDGTLAEWIYVPDTGSQGKPGPGDLTWTGTLANGLPSGLHCNNWTSASADASGTVGYQRHGLATDGSWSNWPSQVTTCGAARRLYCFQQA